VHLQQDDGMLMVVDANAANLAELHLSSL
jgi:hypothetical protein